MVSVFLEELRMTAGSDVGKNELGFVGTISSGPSRSGIKSLSHLFDRRETTDGARALKDFTRLVHGSLSLDRVAWLPEIKRQTALENRLVQEHIASLSREPSRIDT